MTERLDLNVPLAEKDEAKSLGAWWDPHARTWYVPPGKDPAPFQKWLGPAEEAEPDDLLILSPPVFVVESQAGCWKCGKVVPVASVACNSYQDAEGEANDEGAGLYIFSGVTWLPSGTVVALRRVNPGYRRRFSKTAGMDYFMNHCSCGAQLGDFFMHSEPGGAFLPMDAKSAAAIKLRLLSKGEPVKLDGSAGASFPSLIWEHAQRVV